MESGVVWLAQMRGKHDVQVVSPTEVYKPRSFMKRGCNLKSSAEVAGPLSLGDT